LVIQSLGQTQEIVEREGLIFNWPKSTALIPDEHCVALPDFLGCAWVGEEYCLTPDEIKSTHKVDVGSKFTSYNKNDTGTDYESMCPAGSNTTLPVSMLRKGYALR